MFLLSIVLALLGSPDVSERAWRLAPSEAAFLTSDHKFIGLACDADRLTLTAPFRANLETRCEYVYKVEELCLEDPDAPPEPVEAWECALYMGDGW
jgi:hypothetical protein